MDCKEEHRTTLNQIEIGRLIKDGMPLVLRGASSPSLATLRPLIALTSTTICKAAFGRRLLHKWVSFYRSRIKRESSTKMGWRGRFQLSQSFVWLFNGPGMSSHACRKFLQLGGHLRHALWYIMPVEHL